MVPSVEVGTTSTSDFVSHWQELAELSLSIVRLKSTVFYRSHSRKADVRLALKRTLNETSRSPTRLGDYGSVVVQAGRDGGGHL